MTTRFMHYVLGLNAIFIHVLALSRTPESYCLRLARCQETNSSTFREEIKLKDHYVLKGMI